jgi:hypothetical protein
MGTQQRLFGDERLAMSLAKRVAAAAILAIADIDAERSRLYLDLIQISLSQNIPEAFETTMNLPGYEY